MNSESLVAVIIEEQRTPFPEEVGEQRGA